MKSPSRPRDQPQASRGDAGPSRSLPLRIHTSTTNSDSNCPTPETPAPNHRPGFLSLLLQTSRPQVPSPRHLPVGVNPSQRPTTHHQPFRRPQRQHCLQVVALWTPDYRSEETRLMLPRHRWRRGPGSARNLHKVGFLCLLRRTECLADGSTYLCSLAKSSKGLNDVCGKISFDRIRTCFQRPASKTESTTCLLRLLFLSQERWTDLGLPYPPRTRVPETSPTTPTNVRLAPCQENEEGRRCGHVGVEHNKPSRSSGFSTFGPRQRREGVVALPTA